MLRLVLETRVNARRNFCCHRVSTSATRVKNLLTCLKCAPYEQPFCLNIWNQDLLRLRTSFTIPF